MPTLPSGSSPGLYYQTGPADWQPVENQSLKDNRLSARVTRYGTYQVFTTQANAAHAFGECYVFRKEGNIPTLHIELLSSDEITARIYDIAGDKVKEIALPPSLAQIINGRTVYEHELNPSDFKPGVYIVNVTAKKNGQEAARRTFQWTKK